MKHLLLAAAALIAAPALAQTTPAGDPAMPTQQTTPPTDPAAQPTPPAGDPATAPAPAQGAAMPAAPADGASPAGGYQPTGNGMSGPMQPGAPVTFKQAPTPAEAYPAPAPMAKYPICKKGQYDHCMQRGGR
ncbi:MULTISPECIES: hypothetical protein [unclassified Sphingomonas]|uniref:hypothetical protein n=1 Tax=unclassified Sphingomonas TaxID=196159 RepID=UPI001F5ABAB2|nr:MULTISPECIES: hypothetical protein [unclassified Sphingomonas]